MSAFNRALWINSAGALWARLVNTPSKVFWRWDPYPVYCADQDLLWRLLGRANLGPTPTRWSDWASVTPFREPGFFEAAREEDVIMYFLALQRGEKFSEGAVGAEFDAGRLTAALAALIRLANRLPYDTTQLRWHECNV